MPKNDPSFPVTVFFDGACSVCSAEMNHYRRLDRMSRLKFVDIQDEEFDPTQYGPSREDFLRELHVRDTAGLYYRGVDGFAAIWSALPGRFFRIAAVLIRLPLIHGLARVGYWLFARFRRFLPTSSGTCDSGACSVRRHPRRRKD